jgi:hypothetical protein
MPDDYKTDTKMEDLQKARQALVYGPILTYRLTGYCAARGLTVRSKLPNMSHSGKIPAATMWSVVEDMLPNVALKKTRQSIAS